MNLEEVFIGKVIDGKNRIFLRKRYFYDVDRFYYVYKDLKTREVFSYISLRSKLIPFTDLYSKKQNLSKRKILKIYDTEYKEFN